jgi:hypothetical protein
MGPQITPIYADKGALTWIIIEIVCGLRNAFFRVVADLPITLCSLRREVG